MSPSGCLSVPSRLGNRPSPVLDASDLTTAILELLTRKKLEERWDVARVCWAGSKSIWLHA